MCRLSKLPLLLLALLFPPTGPAAAAPPAARCATSCSDLSCYLQNGRCLLEAGDNAAAKTLLKAGVADHGDSTELQLLLARAYWALGNDVWARRVLLRLRQAHPDNCQVRSWLAWLHLDKAELDQAERLLQEEGCPDRELMKARWHLLVGSLARFRKDQPAAAAQLDQALTHPTLFSEDLALLRTLRSYARPGEPKPVYLRLELGGGYTTDGIGSSPRDPGGDDTCPRSDAAILHLDLLARIEPQLRWPVRPLFEGGVRSLLMSRDIVKQYSYLNFTVRPGVAIGDLRLFYGGRFFLQTGASRPDEQGPVWFYETHRAELEYNAGSWLTLFGGVGRSLFQERGRSRTELDGGLGVSHALGPVRVLSALSFRGHQAENPGFDLWGGSLLATATVPIWRLHLRGRFIASWDIYTHSHNDGVNDPLFKRLGVGDRREDLLIKGGAELWSPTFMRLRAGLSYELSRRFSTTGDWADCNEDPAITSGFGYTDHRVLLRLRFVLRWDPWAPSGSDGGEGHVQLPYGIGPAGQGLEDERIQDLLRQEDAAQRGSSCLN